MSADLIFAILPILVLIYLMTKASPLPSAKALPLAAVSQCRRVRDSNDGLSTIAELPGNS